MTPPGFFEGTGMPDAGWWEALWPNPAKVLADVGLKPGMNVVELCCGDGWFTLPIAKIARHVIAIARYAILNLLHITRRAAQLWR